MSSSSIRIRRRLQHGPYGISKTHRCEILTADNADKAKYPTRAVKMKGTNLSDILVGEVVWFGRNVGSGKRR